MDNGLADAGYRICFIKAFKIFLSHKFSAELFSRIHNSPERTW